MRTSSIHSIETVKKDNRILPLDIITNEEPYLKVETDNDATKKATSVEDLVI
jgi:hypothetical protein